MPNKKVIFIGGSSYSGSTMLDMMLSNNPKGFSLGEIHALFNPYRPHHFNPQCGCSNDSCDIWKQVKTAGESNLYEEVFRLFPDVEYLIDSSKNPWWIKKQTARLKQKGIEVEHIVIWKTPEYFAHSMLKRGRTTWKKSWINYYRQYLHLITNSYAIPYEKLVSEPIKLLKKICTSSGIEYKDQMEKFWHKQHHTLFGNDSAKVHLSKDNTPHSSASTDKMAEHREIYNNATDAEELDITVINEIKNDKKIQNLIYVLAEKGIFVEQKVHDNKSNVCSENLSLIEEQYFRRLDQFKKLIGGLTGKYLRIF